MVVCFEMEVGSLMGVVVEFEGFGVGDVFGIGFFELIVVFFS